MAPNVGNIRDSDRISQLNRSGDKGVLELIREDLTIKSDNPMGSFKGSRSSLILPTLGAIQHLEVGD